MLSLYGCDKIPCPRIRKQSLCSFTHECVETYPCTRIQEQATEVLGICNSHTALINCVVPYLLSPATAALHFLRRLLHINQPRRASLHSPCTLPHIPTPFNIDIACLAKFGGVSPVKFVHINDLSRNGCTMRSMTARGKGWPVLSRSRPGKMSHACCTSVPLLVPGIRREIVVARSKCRDAGKTKRAG